MAITKGPLFSLGASGQLAKSLVYGTWKGIKVVRQHVVPANPQTAAQTTQRGLMTSAVSAWKNYFTDATGRAAWNRMATSLSGALSGFNTFTRNAIGMLSTDADASFVNIAAAIAGQLIDFDLLNADDGATGDEAGTFEIWAGATISGMVLQESVAIVAGTVTGTTDQGDIGDVIFCKLRKDSFDRSGVFQLTMIA